MASETTYIRQGRQSVEVSRPSHRGAGLESREAGFKPGNRTDPRTHLYIPRTCGYPLTERLSGGTEVRNQ